MSMFPPGPQGPYNDGRTVQSFKDETDINKILVKAAKAGTLSHLEKHGAHYADYSDMPDLMEAHARMRRGQSIFDELPAELKREFNQSAAEFFQFVNDPANADDLTRVLPALGERGRQLPNLRPNPPQPQPAATTEANATPPAGGPAPPTS